MVTKDEQRDIIEEALEKMDEVAGLLRSLGNNRIETMCLAAFEGQGGGWLGHFERDIIEEELAALDETDDE